MASFYRWSPWVPSILVSLVACACLTSCASTKLAEADHKGIHLRVNQQYVLVDDVVRFSHRGTIDSLRIVTKPIDSLVEYEDYDPYSSRPVGIVPKGAVLEIESIRKLASGELLVIAKLEGVRVIIDGLLDGSKQVLEGTENGSRHDP